MRSLVQRLALLAAALLLSGASHAHARRAQGAQAGGASLLLEVKAEAPRLKRDAERTAEVIRRRCKRLGIACEVRPQTGDAAGRLALTFPASPDAARVRRVLLARGLEVRAVASLPRPFEMLEYATRAEAEAAAKAGEEVVPLSRYGGEESFILTKRAAVVTGDDVRKATVLKSGEGVGWYDVDCKLTADGSKRLELWTAISAGRYYAVVYNGRAVYTNYVDGPLWGNVVVTAALDKAQAEELALVASGGNLPAPVVVVDEASPKP